VTKSGHAGQIHRRKKWMKKSKNLRDLPSQKWATAEEADDFNWVLSAAFFWPELWAPEIFGMIFI
jgi:hypothetical protein